MFDNLTEFWPDMDLDVLHDTVKKFFTTYAENRHKSVVMTPALFMSTHSCDSNKFDYRPYLYNGFDFQFSKMDRLKEHIMMSNVTKQQKTQKMRHAYVGSSKDMKDYTERNAVGTVIDNNNSTNTRIKIPDPFDFANKESDITINEATDFGKTFTPDPEPVAINDTGIVIDQKAEH